MAEDQLDTSGAAPEDGEGAVSMMTFAEAYTMRSTFYRLLGEAGKTLAEAFTQADLENQATIKVLVFEAMAHSLIENHGYTAGELGVTIGDEGKVRLPETPHD